MPAASELPSGTVTFLFTDIEGSTRLLQQLGREGYGKLLSRHNELLRSVFERHGGIEVDRQGDAFFAAFGNAGAAVAAAAEAQRVLALEEWPYEALVRVRMGLNTGEATVGDGGYVGLAVHLAAGVGAAARGGQVLVTSTVARIVEHELPAGGQLRDLGERLLKGLERPERLYALELDDLPGTAFSEPAPARVDGRQSAPLLERDADLAALRALVDAARDGNGRLAVIEGSAGIGKTRLLAEARAMGAGMGLRVLAARGGELEREFAFGIVRQLFEPLLATATVEERAELLAGAAGLAGPLFDESRLDEASAGDVSFSILHGLYWLAANAALRCPTLVMVDDLHWGDAPSLRWLTHLGRRLEGLPLMLAVATRSLEQSEQAALLTELLTDPAAVVLRPGTLGHESVAILARDVLAAESDIEFCAACHDATGGNPLYLRALLLTLAAEGLAPTAEASARVGEVGPEGVARTVALRLSRLPPQAGALARAIAVLGQGAELGLAASLAELEGSEAVAAAAALGRAELLRHEPALEFVHPVVRAAVYETLDVAERGAAHRRAGGLLLNAGALPENAAAHFVRAPAAADAFIVSTMRRAAERSLTQGAADAAIEYLTRALQEQSDAETRGEVLAELGVAERRTNAPAAADHLRAALPLLASAERRGEIALELGRALWFSDRLPEALAVFRGGLDEVDAKRYADLFERLVAELISAAWWEPETYAIAEAAIGQVDVDSLNGGFGSDLLLATLAHHEYRLGTNRDRAVDLARRALASGRLLPSGVVAVAYATQAFSIAGLLDEALTLYQDRLTAARQRGDIVEVALTLMWRGQCQTFRGDIGAALADLREAFDLIVRHDVRVAWPYVTGFLTQALLDAGEADEAARVVAQAGFPEQLPMNGHLVFFRLARGRLRVEGAAPERGVAELLQLGETVRAVRIDCPATLPWRSLAARGLRLRGRGDEGRELVEEELARARRWGAPMAIGMALRTLALLEDAPTGEQRLREAVDVLAPSPARLEHARALIELGSALRRRNERSEARELLRQGVELAHRCGAKGLVDHANEELAATGARPRRILLTGVDSLTASERRVAQLAAEELTNKEIAQALFVTVKTVEVHLSNVYRKLEIGSRRKLGAALAAHAAEPALAAG